MTIKEAVSTAIDRLGDQWGYFVEGLEVPAVKRLFLEWGIFIGRGSIVMPAEKVCS